MLTASPPSSALQQTSISSLIFTGCAVLGWTGVTTTSVSAHPLVIFPLQQDLTSPVINRQLLMELFSCVKIACANHPAYRCWEKPLNVCREQESMERNQLQGSPGCLAASKTLSAPLGSDSGPKSALPMTQWGTDEVLKQQRGVSPSSGTSLLSYNNSFAIITYSIDYQGREQIIILLFPSSNEIFIPRVISPLPSRQAKPIFRSLLPKPCCDSRTGRCLHLAPGWLLCLPLGTTSWQTLTRIMRGWQRVSLLGTEQTGMLWCCRALPCLISAALVPDAVMPCMNPASPAWPDSIYSHQELVIGRDPLLLHHTKTPKRLKGELMTSQYFNT